MIKMLSQTQTCVFYWISGVLHPTTPHAWVQLLEAFMYCICWPVLFCRWCWLCACWCVCVCVCVCLCVCVCVCVSHRLSVLHTRSRRSHATRHTAGPHESPSGSAPSPAHSPTHSPQ